MAFWGRNFVFDSIPSETYSMIISSNDGGEGNTNGSLSVNIKTQEIFRRPVPYFYGVQQSPVLEFPVSITTTEMELTEEDASLVQKWLFGKQGYKKLQIVQTDMEDFYFNCFLIDPQIRRVGNIIRGFDCTVKCDSPFAWGYPVSTTLYTSTNAQTIYNKSDNLFYTYPTLTIKMLGSGGSFYISNNTDGGGTRFLSIFSLFLGETLTINNDLQIITSSTGLNRLANVAPPVNFFRLLPGVNSISVSTAINNTVTISYSPAKRIT